MKRRDFLFTGAAATSGAFLTKSYGQTAATSPLRTGRLVDPKTTGNVSSQDALFDGQNIVYLYRTGGIGFPAAKENTPAQWAIACTTTSGELAWSYPLPRGAYTSLGTHRSSIVIFAMRYVPTPGAPATRPVLLLDPSSGSLTPVGTNDAAGLFDYAGDSAFFRIASGSAQVWTLQDGLVEKLSGIVSPTIEKKFSQRTLVSPDTIAVVDAGGASMAMVSLTSGSVRESVISSDVISARRATTEAAIARSGVDRNDPGAGTLVFITAIGADPSGAINATVPSQGRGVVSLIQLDSNGTASNLGKLQLPQNSAGKPVMAYKLVVANSQLGVLSHGGDIAWYQLPLS